MLNIVQATSQGASSRSTAYVMTAFLCLITLLILFRIVLPCIPSFFLRGRLRVQRLSLTGARGIEWRAQGFGRGGLCTSSHSRDGVSRSTERPSDGFVLQVQRIYLAFGKRPTSQSTTQSSRSWLTIHIEGVGARFPHSPFDEEAKQRKLDKAKAKAAEMETAEAQAKEKEEQRLDALLRGDRSSAAFVPQTEETSAHLLAEGNDETSSSFIRVSYRWITQRALPAIRDQTHRAARAGLFCLVSSLPALMSFVSLEVHRVEVYLQGVESVVRVEEASLELAMALVANGEDARRVKSHQQPAKKAGLPRHHYRRLSEAIISAGTSARGAASSITAGLPAGRGNLRLRFRGLEVIEADLRPGQETQSSQAATSRRSSQDAASTSPPSFTSHTGWAKDHQAANAKIPPNSKLLSMVDVTTFDVALRIEPSLKLGVREAVETSLRLSKMHVCIDAVYRIVRIAEDRKALRSGPMPTVAGAGGDRSAFSRHFAQQRKEPAEKALAALKCLTITLPQISFISDTGPSTCAYATSSLSKGERNRLPSDIEVGGIIKGIHLSVKNSDPTHKKHQRWLGVCGTQNNKPIEHRRAFLLNAGFTSLQGFCRVDRQPVRSEFVYLDDLAVEMRSTWTPFGLFPASIDSKDASRRYFQGDPNEEALLVEISLHRIRGDVKLDCAAALLTFVEMRKAERRSLNQRLEIDRPARESKFDSLLHHMPRLSVGIEIEDFSYRLDSGRATSDKSEHDSSLMLKIPSLSAAFHGSYRDAYIRRNDKERMAAWKALAKDQLEWSLKGDYRDDEPGMTSPRVPSTGFSAFVGRVKDQLSPAGGSKSPALGSRASSSAEQRPREASASRHDRREDEGMSIEEAVSKMKGIINRESEEQRVENELQKSRQDSRLGTQDQEVVLPAEANDETAQPQIVAVPARLVRRPSLVSQEDCGIIYDFESNFTCPAVESFFVFEGISSPDRGRGKENDKSCDYHCERRLTRRHLFAVNNVDFLVSGYIPGMEEMGTRRPVLRLSSHHTKVRAFVEEIDLELWHPSIFSAVSAMWQEVELAKRPFVSATTEEECQTPGELPDQPSAFAQIPEVVHLIDKFHPGLDLWLSIGGISAHVGGNDIKCDPHLCRGVAFEARRIVMELVCQRKGPEVLLTNADWGARSALLLPEDLVMSANALALRHGKAAAAKISIYEIGLFPLLDIEEATKMVNQDLFNFAVPKSRLSTPSSPADTDEETASAIFADAVWAFHDRQRVFETSARHRYHQEDRASNYIFWIPYSATRLTIRPPGATSGMVAKRADEVTIESDGTKLLSFKIQLLHTYCILIAVAALRRLKPEAHTKRPDGEKTKRVRQANPGHKLVRPTIYVDLGVADVHVFVDLPDNVNLFIHLRRLDLRWSDAEGASVLWESFMGAVESPRIISSGLWEEMIRLRDWKVSIDPRGGPRGELKVVVSGDGASIRIPYGYVVYHIIDSTSVAFKATKQLVHQFVKGGKDSIIIPYGEEPKHLPLIELGIRTFTIEAQDDPIETRLNIIWRAGGDENRMRLEREEAFATKIAKLEAEKKLRSNSKSTMSLRSSRGTSKSKPMRKSKSYHSMGSQGSRTNKGSDHTTDSDSGSETDTSESSVDYEDHIREARDQLDVYNSSSWVRRYANARAEQGKREDAIVKDIFGRFSIKAAVELPIQMVQPSRAAPLFRSSMSQFKACIGPPTFPMEDLRDWMHEQGKGTPKDLPYSLLVPLNLRWTMAEWRWELRDYPLPLLDIPPLKPDQPDSMSAFELSGDFCIAEHLSEGNQSIRHVPAVIVPAAAGHPEASEYGINVPKVAMPVKFYGSPLIDINSAHPTRLAWGQSMQPAIADMVRVFDGISSPPPDPSPKLGFWDKLPLILQSRIHLRWKQKGELHLYLKGSRDPYSISGNGAGWVKCWRGDVEIRLGFENEDREFLQFISDEFLLAIPDLREHQDKAAMGTSNKSTVAGEAGGKDGKDKNGKASARPSRRAEDAKEAPNSQSSPGTYQSRRYRKEPQFLKICIKLTNGVRWGASLRHEHTCREETCQQEKACSGDNFYRACRFFERRPHWTVIQRSEEYIATLSEEEQRGDSFYGWRSDFAHLGISIYSPKTGLVVDKVRRGHGRGSNNVYFSPLAWQHFWAWLRLFEGSMGLPIRQGKLFPSAPPPSPKFGRSLGTIKYRFDVAPLYISHLYHQHSRSDWAQGVTTVLGIKARLGVFHIDMHQRQQEAVKERPELKEVKKVFHKPFYEAEADLGDIDLRTLVGRFRDSAKRLADYSDTDAEADEEYDLLDDESSVRPEDIEWVDLNDFVEVDYTPNDEEAPEIRLIQALTCPKFNFYRRFHSRSERREQSGESDDGHADADVAEESKFGNEDPETHTCLIGKAPLNFTVQSDLAKDRVKQLRAEVLMLKKKHKNPDEDLIRDLQKRIKIIEDYSAYFEQGHSLEADLNVKGHQAGADRTPKSETQSEHRGRDEANRRAGLKQANPADGATDLSELFKDLNTFDDRFFFHNPVMIFSNQTRHVLLRYYALYKKRKGFVHHMTARAIYNLKRLSKHLENDYQKKGRKQQGSSSSSSGNDNSRPSNARQTTTQFKPGIELLNGLLDDTQRYVLEDNVRPQSVSTAVSYRSDLNNVMTGAVLDTHVDPFEGIAEGFDIRRSNYCVFLKPQIVMKSRIDDTSTVILTAIRTRLQNFSVVDPTISDEDSVNRRVLSRNYFSMDGLQAFHPVAHKLSSTSHTSGRRQGAHLAVPLETLIDLKHETSDFDKIVSRTDASVRYDKFNRLRLHDSTRPITSEACHDDPGLDHLRHYMDLLRVRCPRFAVSANSTHFGALYNIVTDLILYRAPSWQERAKQLETILFSYDFKDTSLLADLVADLQRRIRRALELDAEYQFHFDDLNKEGKTDLFKLKAELSDLVEELLLIADAITESEDAKGEEDKDKKSALRLEAHAQDLSWNMMGEREGDLLAKLSIKGPSFTWLNKADNSTANSLSIIDLQAVDVRPDAHFAEIISKWTKAPDHPMALQGRFVNAVWSEMAPVGGISLIDQFEFDVHPMHLQMEIKIGRLIMAYIFGSKRHRQEQEEKRKKLLEEHADKASSVHQQSSKKQSHFARLTGGGRSSIETCRDSSETSTPIEETPSRRTSTSSAQTDRQSTFRNKAVSHTSSSETRLSVMEAKKSDRDRDRNANDSATPSDDEEDLSQFAIAKRNAEEMRQRAASNLTFLLFKLPETVFCLSYKGEKEKSITDVYDLVFKSPTIEYRNRTWTYEDLVHHIKKDVFRAAWGQRTTIVKSILSHRPKRPEALRNIREKQMLLLKGSKETRSISPLQLSVQPPTPRAGSPEANGGGEGWSSGQTGETKQGGESIESVLRPGSNTTHAEFSREEGAALSASVRGRDQELQAVHSKEAGDLAASESSAKGAPAKFSRFIQSRLNRSRDGTMSSGTTGRVGTRRSSSRSPSLGPAEGPTSPRTEDVISSNSSGATRATPPLSRMSSPRPSQRNASGNQAQTEAM